jgi:hypothetical protein
MTLVCLAIIWKTIVLIHYGQDHESTSSIAMANVSDIGQGDTGNSIVCLLTTTASSVDKPACIVSNLLRIKDV